MVGELDNGLSFRFVADFRAAENNFDFRTDALDGGDDFGGLFDVPDINAEADDFRFAREQHFGDVERTLVDVEFDETGARFQFTEVGE